jgi:transcription elongation factor Elf1
MADFIDDDESDADAQEMTRATMDALRNRRKWKETEFHCPLCADLRVVLQHLLRHK